MSEFNPPLGIEHFLFYDLETTGISSSEDRILEFGAVLTDFDFNEIESFHFYLSLTDDILPSIDSFLVHGIDLDKVKNKSISEALFCEFLHNKVFAQHRTVILGYNNIKFDDEFIRYTLWRNFYDPYKWQYQNQNSVWDILPLVRATRALRPEGIIWPTRPSGEDDNSLGALTSANNVTHEDAHSAISDVYATIELAKLIRQSQPELFNYFLTNRNKEKVAAQLSFTIPSPLIHISGQFGPTNHYSSVILPICNIVGDSQGVFVYDLRIDPSQFLDLSVAELSNRIYQMRDSIIARLPIKKIQFNKSPILAPTSLLKDPKIVNQLNLNINQINKNLKLILSNFNEFSSKIHQALINSKQTYENDSDPSNALYQGFPPRADTNQFTRIHCKDFNLKFIDPRLSELLPLYVARNFPKLLSDEQSSAWSKYLKNKYKNGTKIQPPLSQYIANLEKKLSKVRLAHKKKIYTSLLNRAKSLPQI